MSCQFDDVPKELSLDPFRPSVPKAKHESTAKAKRINIAFRNR
ncbi:hypothetical protein RBSWK_01917 [Rhodopirellula baltica SWK14]|uniref:Uncharacterized protein n=1 Tax=Rhodopirellula baltica SWK14 TaxID=993516 RepID=L7CM85_RHOBT|nr:hypothetical protein RBSWK_01917 [Rhodopirellula baltica SWK14]